MTLFLKAKTFSSMSPNHVASLELPYNSNISSCTYTSISNLSLDFIISSFTVTQFLCEFNISLISPDSVTILFVSRFLLSSKRDILYDKHFSVYFLVLWLLIFSSCLWFISHELFMRFISSPKLLMNIICT